MRTIFPIEFEYEHHNYCGIVRVRQQHGATTLIVRLMSSRMDRLFYGHHVFNLVDNKIEEDQDVKGQAASIRKMVEQTLEDYLEPMAFSTGHD
jgi:hypothetical protein